MMNPTVFLKAHLLLRDGKIQPVFWTKKWHIDIHSDKESYRVILWMENGILKWSCDCKFMGVRGIPRGGICSHVLAALTNMVIQCGNGNRGISKKRKGDDNTDECPTCGSKALARED